MTINRPEVFEVYRTRQGTLENVVLLADYEALQAEYEKLLKDAELKHAALEREVEPWIPVSERLPEKGVLVLVYTPPCYGQEESSTGLDLIDLSSDGDVWLIHSESYEHYCAVSDGINCTGPDETAPYTHWMPLPAAPKEKSDE